MGEYLVKLMGIMGLTMPIWLLLRRPWRKWSRREAAMMVFVLFMAGLLVLALEGEYASPGVMLSRAQGRWATGEQINLIPFYTIRTFFRHTPRSVFLVNIVGNLVMFIPWGFGLVLLWQKNRRLWRLVLLALMLTVLIEMVQLFIGRHVDVDDLMLNFAGTLLGAGLWAVLRRLLPVLDTFTEEKTRWLPPE